MTTCNVTKIKWKILWTIKSTLFSTIKRVQPICRCTMHLTAKQILLSISAYHLYLGDICF